MEETELASTVVPFEMFRIAYVVVPQVRNVMEKMKLVDITFMTPKVLKKTMLVDPGDFVSTEKLLTMLFSFVLLQERNTGAYACNGLLSYFLDPVTETDPVKFTCIVCSVVTQIAMGSMCCRDPELGLYIHQDLMAQDSGETLSEVPKWDDAFMPRVHTLK